MTTVHHDCWSVTADCGLILMNEPFPKSMNIFSMSFIVFEAKLICIFCERSISLACSSFTGISLLPKAFLMINIPSFAHWLMIFVFCDWMKSLMFGIVSYIGNIQLRSTKTIPTPITVIRK